MNCSPTGKPSLRPHGIEIPGRPATLTGSVHASDRYIATGSAIRAPKRNATVGEVGATSASKPCAHSASKSPLIKRPDLLGLQVVRVVVAGRQGIRAEHEPALHLGAEQAPARGEVVVEHVAVAEARAVADAVVTGEVRRGLGRGHDVVGGQPVFGVRERDLLDDRPGRLECRNRLADALFDARLHPGHEVLAWEPEPLPAERGHGLVVVGRQASSSSGTGAGEDVESRSSRPATACSIAAASRASRPIGPI